MLELRIQQHFVDSADLKYQASQLLSKPIAAAVHAMLATITGGGKVLACGDGASVTAAQHLVAALVGRFERERPELAALALGSDGALLGALRAGEGEQQALARQLRALGQAGDLVLAISPDGNADALLAVIEAAHERDMIVVALTGASGGRMAHALRETDVHVCVPHERASRVHEVHLLALHCICDGLDLQLLGELESPA